MSLHLSARADRAVYTIGEFCDAHRISRGMVYLLWAQGAGPKWFNVGTRRLISDEAAAQWRREREAAAEKATKSA
jgi:hypothetical protein